uniref:Uncharacterized protein n=1 Tax=Arundo donax TaxID=35708 RepID=A0A0A9D315_ARUDO
MRTITPRLMPVTEHKCEKHENKDRYFSKRGSHFGRKWFVYVDFIHEPLHKLFQIQIIWL